MTYEAVRAFAGTWGLIYLFAVFVGVVIYILRPGKGAVDGAQDAANIPFNEDR